MSISFENRRSANPNGKSVRKRISDLEDACGLIPTVLGPVIDELEDEPAGELRIVDRETGKVLRREPLEPNVLCVLPDNGRGPK